MKVRQMIFAAAMALGGLMLFRAWRHYERNQKHEVHMPMKTYAAGRFQIDIPEPSTLAGWGRQNIPEIGSATISSPIALVKFKRTIQDRKEELKSVERDFEKFIREDSLDTVPAGHGSLLEKSIEGPLPNESIILFWKEDGYKHDLAESEVYYWLQDPKAHAGTGIGYIFNDGMWVDRVKQQADIKQVSDTLSRIRLRSNEEVPEEPGFCFENSFLPCVAQTGGGAFEAIGAEWRMQNHPDVVISLYTQGPPQAKTGGLLARNKRPLPDALKGFIHGIRARKRDLGPFAGEEVVQRVKEENGTTAISAQWEFEGGDHEDMTRPYVMVSMFTGTRDKSPVNGSLSEKQFLAMWDSVLDTLKWRGHKSNKTIHDSSK